MLRDALEAIERRLRDRLKQLEDSARAFVVSNELDRILTENGAQGLNASTSHDRTSYYETLPASEDIDETRMIPPRCLGRMARSAWCATVSVKPEVTSRMVLTK